MSARPLLMPVNAGTTARVNVRRPQVLHLQYSDPAAYPPVQHATRLLTRAGFDVSLLSLHAPGESRVLAFPTIDHARVRYLGDLDRPSAKTFARFIATATAEAIATRPRWLYVSDPTAAPAALAIHRSLGIPIVYHEHDSPSAPGSTFTRIVSAARARVARAMTAGVLPNADRATQLRRETRTRQPIHVVWNCASRVEAAPEPRPRSTGPMRLLYQGTLVPTRLPLATIDALAAVDGVELHVCGYETGGGIGHVAALIERARSLSISSRLVVHGPVPERAAMLEITRSCDVGLAMLQLAADINLRFMLGASNKPFDYLSQGLALLVSDRPDWRAMFVDGGFGRAADLGSVASLVDAFTWFRDHPDERAAMGERGRRRVLDEWCYERQFQPVLDLMATRL